MFALIAEWFRKLSLIVLGVGVLVAFYTEAFADIPIGKDGRPKPSMTRQRLQYLLVVGAAVPGVAWATVRTVRGQQRNPWE